MWKNLYIIIAICIFVFLLIPNMLLNASGNEFYSTKRTLNLSARVLVNAVDKQKSNADVVSEGFYKKYYTDIQIDHDRLLREFYDVVEKNLVDKDRMDSIKDSIQIKAVVYHDRFFICDKSDKWGPPLFFGIQYMNKDVYLNSKDDMAFYYDNSGQKIYEDISFFGISEKEKEQLIIDRVNEAISKYTVELGLRKGMGVKIFNPDEADAKYKVENSHFNILDGLTFFVVYASDSKKTIFDEAVHYTNYNVVGYTMDDIKK